MAEPRNFVKLFADELLNLSCSFFGLTAVVFEKVGEGDCAERQSVVVDEVATIVINKVG